MIRTVPTGDLGLDLLLGGGWRLVKRLADRESATVVVRGGPGVGKTLMALDVARGLARGLGGDVAVGCVEVLPSEYVAQLHSARRDMVDGSVVVSIPVQDHFPAREGSRVFCGLLGDLDPSAPDLVAGLETLRSEVRAAGGRPVVFVVDSLIEGYGLGASASRLTADAVMKFAAQDGSGLVLCEETAGDAPSPWVFAADTVIELGTRGRDEGRWIQVRKHRFGASATGGHPFELAGWGQSRVLPRAEAWLHQGVVREVLEKYGWHYVPARGTPALHWPKAIHAPIPVESFGGSFAFIAAPDSSTARRLAFGLLPEPKKSKRDSILELDPITLRSHSWSGDRVDVHYTPTAGGAEAGLLNLVVSLGKRLFGEGAEQPRRVILGDVARVASSAEAGQWAEAVRVLAVLLRETGQGIPLIVYDGGSGSTPDAVRAPLRQYADIVVDVHDPLADGGVPATVMSRIDGSYCEFTWLGREFDLAALPDELAHLERLPIPADRKRPKRRPK